MEKHKEQFDNLALIDRIADEIGPRLPASEEEYAASQLIANQLRTFGIENVQEQPFYAVQRLGERVIPAALLSTVGLVLSLGKRAWQQRLGNQSAFWAALLLRRVLGGRSPFWEGIWPQRRSQNIVARLAPQGEVRSRIVFIAHMDSDRVRFSTRPAHPATPALLDYLALGTLFTTSLPVPKGNRTLRRLNILSLLLGTGLATVDELSPLHAGKNDNGSGIGLLLELASELLEHPLEHTEVVLAFTGSDTVAGQGTVELARHHQDEWQDAWWIVIDSLGAGELCWVTASGLSPRDTYQAHEEAQALMQRVAAAQPDLGVVGRQIRGLDAVAPLAQQRLKAVALTGYDPLDGLPYAVQTDEIDEDCMHKARQFTRSLINIVEFETGVEEDD